MNVFEINQAFAEAVAATCEDLEHSVDILSVNGGAIALGHPRGTTGVRLLLTLTRELRGRAARRGVAALCGDWGKVWRVLIEVV